MGLSDAAVGIISTGVVGVASPLITAYAHRGDRRHDKELRAFQASEEHRVRTRDAYVDALAYAEHLLSDADRRDTANIDRPPLPAIDLTQVFALQARVAAFGSREATSLFALLVAQHRKLLSAHAVLGVNEEIAAHPSAPEADQERASDEAAELRATVEGSLREIQTSLDALQAAIRKELALIVRG
jgi:hypothetical protein